MLNGPTAGQKVWPYTDKTIDSGEASRINMRKHLAMNTRCHPKAALQNGHGSSTRTARAMELTRGNLGVASCSSSALLVSDNL